MDTHNFTVPVGQKYVRYAVNVDKATNFSGYSIKSAPSVGDTGSQRVLVKWWYNPFGKIRYTLDVYSGDVEIITICFGENNWVGKAQNAIQENQNFKIVMRGPQEKELSENINAVSGVVEPVSTTVITLAIVLGFMSIAAFATMAAVLIYAIHEGYNAKATHKVNGPNPLDDELTIEVTKP